MSLNHDFYVVPKYDTCKDRVDKSYYTKSKFSKIEISDEFILYIYDSLKWIKAFNPFKEEHHFGINYHGITLLEKEGVEKMYKIANAWILLFENATENIILRGRYVKEKNRGYYQKLKLRKERVLEELNAFSKILEEALNEDKHIVHFGI